MKKFVLIGAAGYVAPKHMKAIKEMKGELVAALDPHSSVGIIDSYFPDCDFFTEFERFDRYCSKRHDIDYVVICSPNYLHDSHCRFGLRLGANVICEKPLVLNERNLDGLSEMEEQYGKKINSILQLRLNEDLIKLRSKIQNDIVDTRPSLIYHTPRGNWYYNTWKSESIKSGGLCTNIGIHLFDMLTWIYGYPTTTEVINIYSNKLGVHTVKGTLYFSSKVAIDFDLSIEKSNKPTRILNIGGYVHSFTKGFTDLHTKSYFEILEGRGFGIEDVRNAIRLCEDIRRY